MSVSTALQTLPTFSAAYLTSTTVSDAFIEANNCENTYCPALVEFMDSGEESEVDPFRAVTAHRIIQINADTEAQLENDNLVELNSIHHINQNLKLARDARLTGDFASAISSYRHIVQLLEGPVKENSERPIYSVIPKGTQILSEALFGATALSKEQIFGIDRVRGTAPAIENIERLGRHIVELEALLKMYPDSKLHDATKRDLATAKILQAFNLMQHASSADIQHDSLYWRVEKLVSDAIYPESDGKEVKGPALINPANGVEEAEIHFLGGLLIVEALARRMELSHKSKNPTAFEKFADRITYNLGKIYDAHFKKNKDETSKDYGKAASVIGNIEENVELFASYEAQVAVLKYKLGLGWHALKRVRSIVEGSLDHTAAAQSLRDHEYFEHFFDAGRFLQTGEIADSAAPGALWRRLQAAFMHAHSPSLKNSLFAGTVGMLGGIISAALTGNPEFGWAAGGAGASLVEGGYQLYNGWNSRQARDAAKIGTNPITGQQTAVDITKFVGKRFAAALMWSLPSAMVANGPEVISTVGDTMANIPDGYATAFSRIVDCPEILFPNPFDGDIGHTLYQFYTKGAGALFLTNLLWKGSRKYTKDIAFAFIPGALMFSADIGLAIAPPDALTDPHDAWVDRVWRAGIVGIEMLFMMLTTGLAPLAKTGSFKESIKSLGKTLLPIKGNADYNLPLAAMIVTGLSSPIGGIFQQGLMRPEDIPLIAAQGAAITMGLLGLTLGMSGILKRQIPIGASIVRSVKDVTAARNMEAAIIAKGGIPDTNTELWRYPYEAVRGVGAAFNVGYVRNRVLRIPGPDMAAATLRLILGGGEWDNNRAQAAMSVVNGFSGNSYWDSTFPSASGTQYEEMSFINAVDKALIARESPEERIKAKIEEKLSEKKRKEGNNFVSLTAEEEKAAHDEALKEPLELLNDFFRKAGQVIHPMHFFLPHNSWLDRLWPLYSFTRTVMPPTFPQRPNPSLYASVYQVLVDHIGSKKTDEEVRRDPEKLSMEQFELVLDYIKTYASDTTAYHVMRPLVKTLLIARNSERFGGRIESFFFKENPQLFTLLSIDPDKAELQAFEERFSRIARGNVRRIVKQSPETYERRIRRYHRKNGSKDGPHDMFGMFQTILDPAAFTVKGDGAKPVSPAADDMASDFKGPIPPIMIKKVEPQINTLTPPAAWPPEDPEKS